ncbi:MAG: hypothetical protein MK106_07135 [Mariniblastus sp.]|nr:hypothetical protein [Mariniblastus sp.]
MLWILLIIGGLAIILGVWGTRSETLARWTSSDSSTRYSGVNTPSQVNLQVKEWVNKAQQDHGHPYARVPNRTSLRR